MFLCGFVCGERKNINCNEGVALLLYVAAATFLVFLTQPFHFFLPPPVDFSLSLSLFSLLFKLIEFFVGHHTLQTWQCWLFAFLRMGENSRFGLVEERVMNAP